MTGRWRGEERERERAGEEEKILPPHVLRAAIYFHYAHSDSFPISSSARCIGADGAPSHSPPLMTHHQAWQHIIDMPIQIDVSAFLSDIQLRDTNLERVK